MKRYNSVFELAAELDADGFIRDRDIFIPADESPEGDKNAGCLHCDDGTLYSYPKFKAYYIHIADGHNKYGQLLRDPEEHNPHSEGYTPFGDE